MTNTFSITMYDDGTGIDENANQPLNPANPIGNNAVPFDLLEGSTAQRFVNVTTGAGPVVVAELPRPDGSGLFNFSYGRMDLLGTNDSPVLVGYSIGNQSGANPTGQCEIDLGTAGLASDTGFGNIQSQTEVRWPTFIGDGSEPEIHELFHNGNKGSIDGTTGIITLAVSDFDLKFEGNGSAAPATSEPNRERVGFYGMSCQLPSKSDHCHGAAQPVCDHPIDDGLD